MVNYYNEIDSYAAQWLRNLIQAGHIAPGIVDERSITDVKPADLAGYTQCHFFAGIGVWSHALRQSGWPDSRPVWTGSCPCQPFSAAGNGGGVTDKRHLWPVWFNLIRECRPPVVFGEQVAAAIGYGWLDLVCDDLEREGYAVGAVGLPAGAFGAAHVRQRIWWVADTDGVRLPRPWQCQQPSGSSSQAFREADQFGDAVQRDALPFLCLSHDGVSTQLAQGFLRGYGNAIVPQVAAAFIDAYLGVTA